MKTKPDQPFGHFAPSRMQTLLLRISRAMPYSWLGMRISFLIRRILRWGMTTPLDMIVYGQKMRLYGFDNVTEARTLFAPQHFDPLVRAALAERCRDGFVFLDIGANTGAYSFFVVGLGTADTRVLAFEPQPEMLSRFRTSLSFNPDAPIQIHGFALGAEDGEMRLLLHGGNKGQASLKVRGKEVPSASVPVQVRPLLKVLQERKLEKISALKIDVEGVEDQVLIPFFETAPKSLWPELLIIEDNRTEWDKDCIALCRSLGYRKILRDRENIVFELVK